MSLIPENPGVCSIANTAGHYFTSVNANTDAQRHVPVCSPLTVQRLEAPQHGKRSTHRPHWVSITARNDANQ